MAAAGRIRSCTGRRSATMVFTTWRPVTLWMSLEKLKFLLKVGNILKVTILLVNILIIMIHYLSYLILKAIKWQVWVEHLKI